jgi:SecY interacting protein Syd
MTSPNQANDNLVDILRDFVKRYVTKYQDEHVHLPIIEHDEEWPSPCEVPIENTTLEQTTLSDGQVFWQPKEVQREEKLNFENVESALGLNLHPDIKQYFTLFYSESLEAQCDEGNLSLLFAWNPSDFLRLQENLIGHIMMKQRLKQEETIFFAVTDEEDMIISLDNESGSVWVERVGCKPHKKLSNTLAQFISNLIPTVD